MQGTVENPIETMRKTVPIPIGELGKLGVEIAEIQQLLTFGLLLAHTAFLPATQRSSSTGDFPQDPSERVGLVRSLHQGGPAKITVSWLNTRQISTTTHAGSA